MVKIKVKIPPKTGNNTKMIQKGKGNIKKGMAVGDLIFVITYNEHHVFNVSDNHLIIIKKIKFGTSLLGTKFHVKLLNGKDINLEFNGPIFDGDIRGVQNHGISINNIGTGDLIVKFEVEKDLILAKEQIKIIMNNFPIDKFHIEECENVNCINPELFEKEEVPHMHNDNVQCAQQ